VEREIKIHAEEAYPEECCGIVSQGEYLREDNAADDPTTGFIIEPARYLRVLRARGVQALVHSHPDPLEPESEDDPDGQQCALEGPSAWDMRSQETTAVPWGVVLVDQGHAEDLFWWGDQLDPIPLLNRPFRHGVADCYALVRDWYRQERRTGLPLFPRDDRYWLKGQNLLEDNFETAGFRSIGKPDPKELRVGDVLLAKVRSRVMNHCGVYVGGDSIMHVLPGRLSRCETMMRWWNYIEMVVRRDDR